MRICQDGSHILVAGTRRYKKGVSEHGCIENESEPNPDHSGSIGIAGSAVCVSVPKTGSPAYVFKFHQLASPAP